MERRRNVCKFVLLCCYQTLTDKSRPDDVKKKEVVMYQRNNIKQCLVIRNHHNLSILWISYNKESYDTHYIGRTFFTDVDSPSDNIRRFNTTPPNMSKRNREIKEGTLRTADIFKKIEEKNL